MCRLHEQEMIARRRRLLGPAYRLFYAEPGPCGARRGRLALRSRRPRLSRRLQQRGVGRPLPSARRGGAVASRRRSSTRTPDTCTNRFSTTPRAVARLFPRRELGHVMFTCTGSEANDLALRVAKAHTGGTGVIVTRIRLPRRHQRASPRCRLRLVLGMRSATTSVPCRRPMLTGRWQDVGAAFAAACSQRDRRHAGKRHQAGGADRRHDLLQRRRFRGSAGLPAASASRKSRKAGGLFIADEVQPGFGRTGGRHVGIPAPWDRARYRDPRKAHGQRSSGRRHGGASPRF